MKIAIIGSRKGFSEYVVHKRLDILASMRWPVFSLISGGARGVDKYAKSWAKKNKKDIEIIKPIDSKIKINYLYRDIEILTKADEIIAFWDGRSRGTKFVIDYAIARGKNPIIFKK